MKVGGAEGIVVAEKCRTEILRQVDIETLVRVGYDVARVVNERDARANVPCAPVHAVEQFGALYVVGIGKVVDQHRTCIQIVGKAPQQTYVGIDLAAVHLRLVGIVVAHLVADAPEVALERVE